MHDLTRQSAFTLIELLVTIAIVVIVMAIASPNLVGTIQDNRITTNINSLSASLNLARSEAVKRGLPTIVCPSNNGTSCQNTDNWANGWLIFEDEDGDAVLDNNEEVLRVSSSLENNLTLTFDNNARRLVYDAIGFASNTGSFRLCDDRGKDFGRMLAITTTTSPKVEKGLSKCTS
jgi:type IV fimbrial biogenesis protein FimT